MKKLMLMLMAAVLLLTASLGGCISSGGSSSNDTCCFVIFIVIILLIIALLFGRKRTVQTVKTYTTVESPSPVIIEQSQSDRRCPNCGRAIPLDARICPYCSKKF
jgi:predicted permease